MVEADTATGASVPECLLIVLSRVRDDFPLVVAANRDELLDRPAQAMTVLHPAGPRVLGGRDEQGGGTWLALNESGVFAGLTNRPTTDGRDPSKRSRGEIPLALALRAKAADAVDELAGRFHPGDYNPCWVLAGDRSSLFAVDMSRPELAIEELAAGIHILENRPLGAASPKVSHLRAQLQGVEDLAADDLEGRLRNVLRDHETPEARAEPNAEPTNDEFPRPLATEAACVHAEHYGTRWSGVITVPRGDRLPSFSYADGPPCRADFFDATTLWRDDVE